MGEITVMIIWLGLTSDVLDEPSPTYKRDLIHESRDDGADNNRSQDMLSEKTRLVHYAIE